MIRCHLARLLGERKMRLSAQWREQQTEAARLDAAIAANLEYLGFEQ